MTARRDGAVRRRIDRETGEVLEASRDLAWAIDGLASNAGDGSGLGGGGNLSFFRVALIGNGGKAERSAVATNRCKIAMKHNPASTSVAVAGKGAS